MRAGTPEQSAVFRAAAGAMVLIAAASFLPGCAPRQNTVSLAGATSFQALSEALAAAYMEAHPGTRITIHPADSATGIQAVLSGVVQIGISDHATLPPEASGLQAVEVARDEIAIIVHPANTVSNLSLGQIRDIFGGKIRTWSEVGGKDHGIDVVVREQGSGTRMSFEEEVGGVAPNTRVVLQDTSRAVLATVAANENAIGYVSHGLADDSVNVLFVGGIACDAASASQGLYPLSRRIKLLTRGTPGGVAQAFIEFALSEDGKRIIREHGLVAP